jgi:uncharacterized membrane protein
MDAILSVLVLTAIALTAGAIWRWRRAGPSTQVWLMLVLAVVMIANVLIVVLPDSSGTAPLSRAPVEGAR